MSARAGSSQYPAERHLVTRPGGTVPRLKNCKYREGGRHQGGSLDTPAPLLGEHNSHVLKDLIGLTDDEYNSLEEDGVLE